MTVRSPIWLAMNTAFVVLMVLAMLAVVASLGAGLVAMTRGDASHQRQSNRMMRARVLLQGLAIVLFLLAMLAAR